MLAHTTRAAATACVLCLLITGWRAITPADSLALGLTTVIAGTGAFVALFVGTAAWLRETIRTMGGLWRHNTTRTAPAFALVIYGATMTRAILTATQIAVPGGARPPVWVAVLMLTLFLVASFWLRRTVEAPES